MMMGSAGSIFLTSLAFDSLVIFGLILVLCRFLSGVSASIRHQLIAGAFIAVLIMPVLVLFLPTWDTAGILDTSSLRGLVRTIVLEDRSAFGSGEPETLAEDGIPGTGKVTAVDEELSRPRLLNTESPVDRKDASTGLAGPVFARIGSALKGRMHILLLIVWAVGALSVMIVQLVRWAGAGFIAEMSSEQQDPETRRIAERVRNDSGLRRPVSLLRSEMTAVTMAWGIFRSFIILPSDSDSWSVDKMEEVLRHEMAHLKRRDNMVLIIAVLACAVYWFNPLVWKALKRLHYEREVSCDDFVINSGGTPSSYARHLMEISMKLSGVKNNKIIPAAMAHSSNVKKRLISVLDPSKNRRPAGLAASLVCLFLVIGLAMPVAAFRPWDVQTVEAAGSSDVESLDVETIESILLTSTDDDEELSREEIKRLRKRLAELKKEQKRLLKEQRELLRKVEKEHRDDRSERSREVRDARRMARAAERAEQSARSRAVARSRSRASARKSARASAHVWTSSDSEDSWSVRPDHVSDMTWRIKGTICSGEDRYRLDRTTLEHIKNGYRVESRDVLFEPDSDEGLSFESDSGYLKITFEDDEETVEYWICPKDGRRAETLKKTVHVNGSEVPLDRSHERRIRGVIDDITDLLEDVGSIGSSSADLHLDEVLESEEIEALEETLLEIEELDLLSDEMEDHSEVFEDFAELFEEIKDFHIDEFEDEDAGRIIEEAYRVREPRIERLVRDGIRVIEYEHDYDKALDLVADILDEYSEVALRSLDSVKGRDSKKDLKEALMDLYEDLGDTARETLEDLEEDECEASDTAKKLYDLLINNARATRKEIERK